MNTKPLALKTFLHKVDDYCNRIDSVFLSVRREVHRQGIKYRSNALKAIGEGFALLKDCLGVTSAEVGRVRTVRTVMVRQ